MRNLDLSPLYRATIGFDRMADLVDRALSSDGADVTYPPYNIEKTGDDSYRITLAVAGFSADDLSVELREGALIVSGRKAEPEGERSYMHRGIATRAFERKFTLAEHIRVAGASNQDGLLHIDLIREVPEALKPRRIAIEKAQPRPVGQLDA